MAVTKVKQGRTPYQAVNPIYGGDYPQVAPLNELTQPALEAQVRAYNKGIKASKPGTSSSVGGTSSGILPAHS